MQELFQKPVLGQASRPKTSGGSPKTAPESSTADILLRDYHTVKARNHLTQLLGASLRQAFDPLTIYQCLVKYGRKKFNWELHKRLDILAFFVSREGELAPEMIHELEFADICDEDFSLVTGSIEKLHLLCLPPVGFGTSTAHAHMPDIEPTKVAFEHGYRFFDCVDPDPREPSCDTTNRVELIGRDLRDTDLTGSDVVLVSKPVFFGVVDVRASFESMVSNLGPLNTKEGQPAIDCYMLRFEPDLCGCISDVWGQMEALVDEGKVRALGVAAFTIRQVEELLEVCRIRPSVACFEHPGCATPSESAHLVEFCHSKRIALFATVDPCDQTHGSPRFDHPHISVVPGAKAPAHIIENISVADIEAADPVAIEKPERMNSGSKLMGGELAIAASSLPRFWRRPDGTLRGSSAIASFLVPTLVSSDPALGDGGWGIPTYRVDDGGWTPPSSPRSRSGGTRTL
jgi:diketogulonate reductase-like aldo/keto reductase